MRRRLLVVPLVIAMSSCHRNAPPCEVGSELSSRFTVAATPPYVLRVAPLARVAAVGPLYTTANHAVEPAALEQAGIMLAVMLRHRPDVAERLRMAGAVTVVVGRDEHVCDLPYFADLKGTSSCDATGGLGGTPKRPYTACSERNILRMPDDHFGRGSRPSGENVCVHELAHGIMNIGVTDEERKAIRERYSAALREGLWAGDFAMKNDNEFFAEMSQAYYCANPKVPAFQHGHAVNCAASLRTYDPTTYSLLDGLYREPADLE
jgi:hypothetical protein